MHIPLLKDSSNGLPTQFLLNGLTPIVRKPLYGLYAILSWVYLIWSPNFIFILFRLYEKDC